MTLPTEVSRLMSHVFAKGQRRKQEVARFRPRPLYHKHLSQNDVQAKCCETIDKVKQICSNQYVSSGDACEINSGFTVKWARSDQTTAQNCLWWNMKSVQRPLRHCSDPQDVKECCHRFRITLHFLHTGNVFAGSGVVISTYSLLFGARNNCPPLLRPSTVRR